MGKMANIGEVNYASFEAQKNEVRARTEKSIKSLLKKGILNQLQCEKLLKKYLLGEISFGDDGLTEEEANAFTSDVFDEIEQNLETVKSNFRSKTLYIIQPGDTPLIIAKKMGLDGEEANEFARTIMQNAQKKNMYYKFRNNISGFKVGDMIELPGDYTDKIEALRNEGTYQETTSSLDNAYTIAINRKENLPQNPQDKVQPTEPTTPEEPRTPTNPEKPENPGAQTPSTEPEAPEPTTPILNERPPFGIDERHRQEGPTEAQITERNKIYDEAVQIVKSLGYPLSPNNPVLKRITPKNVVFVIKMYKDTFGVDLTKELIKNGDKKGTVIYNKICCHIYTRARQFQMTDIHLTDARNAVNHPDEIIKWVETNYVKVLNAEKKFNPAFVSNADYEVSRQRIEYEDTKQLKTDSTKIAKDLHDALHDSYDGNWASRSYAEKVWKNRDNSMTKTILKMITPANVAFVVQIYKQQYKKSLAHEINDEWIGLSIKDIKDQLCSKLVTQVKKLKLTNLNLNYSGITDIDRLADWMHRISKAIVDIMESQSSTLPQDNTQEQVTTKTDGTKTITITNGNMFVEADITKIVEEYDSNGNLVQATIYYKNGKEVIEKYEKNKDSGKIELKQRILVKRGNSSKKTLNSPITEAVPMEIKLPQNANRNAKKFAQALEKNKARLMKLLKIDSDTYNRLAKLAMAIAEQETNFGSPDVLSVGGVKYYGVLTNPVKAEIFSKGKPLSFGPTQIKFDLHIKDADVKALWSSLGITMGTQLFNIENSALATMVLLSVLDKRVKAQKIQDGIEAANGRIITHDGWEKKNGTLVKSYNTRSYINQVDEDDAICYLWNRGSKEILNGTIDPLGNTYTRNVRQYKNKYTIQESESDRKKAIEKSKTKKEQNSTESNKTTFTPMDNNGAIGSIIFMPVMYSNKPINKKEEIDILKKELAKNKKIKQADKDELIKAVKNGELAFEFGLTAKEIAALTQNDVDKLLNHLKKLKQQIEKETNVKFSDGISIEEAKVIGNKYRRIVRSAEYNFKRDYLNSYSKRVNLKDINNDNVTKLNNSSAQLSLNQKRKGFVGNIPDKGISSANTSAASLALAKFAQKTSNTMTQNAKNKGKSPGGMCMTGFRQAIRAAGIDDSDLKEGKPRASVAFFERHPDMFEEVKWIDIGNGNGRQINSTDLPKLPAGYIVIWVPDPGFAEKEGHISITNGNGQAYSDETDNLDWGTYSGTDYTGKDVSGKGEHGHFRVFRLTNKWSVDPNTGKLVFNK